MKTQTDWLKGARVVKGRPTISNAAAKPSMNDRLTALLKGTLKGGAIRLNRKDLTIDVKSLRTQVAIIARKLGATSHVLVNENTETLDMWLEVRSKKTAATARPNNGKTKKARRPRATKAAEPVISDALLDVVSTGSDDEKPDYDDVLEKNIEKDLSEAKIPVLT